jgi:type VI secretion system protein ImpA
MRAAPLEWLGTKFEEPLRLLPVTSSGLTWVNYKESRTVGYESEATNEEKRKARQQLINDGKLTPEEFDEAVDQTPVTFYEKLQKDAAESVEALNELAELCDEKFGDYSPSLIKTRTALEDLAQLARIFITKKGGPSQPEPEPEPEPEEEAPPVVEAAPAPAPAPAPAAPKAPPKAAPAPVMSLEPANLEDAVKRLGAIARFLRSKDEYDIAPFLILRGLRWGEIRYNGPQIDSRMLEAPPPDLRAELKSAVLGEQWDKVLELTERAMELPCGRAWLDIQRYAVLALEKKGDWYAFVAGAIKSSLRALLEDLPGLLDMTLMDDTPVANAETMAWIRSDVLGGAAVAARPPAPAPEPEPEPEPQPQPQPQLDLSAAPPSMNDTIGAEEAARDVFEDALELARRGREREAIEMISKELAAERSGRGRFKRKMQLAHLFMAGGKSRIAHPILEQLASEIDQRKLEEWEAGEVLAYPLSLFLECLKSEDLDPELRKQIYYRICRLDPAQALRISD